MKRYSMKQLFRRERRRGDLVFAVTFFVLCLVLLYNLGDQTRWTPRTKLVAQPAFWPTLSVTGMSIFAAFHLFGSLTSPRIAGRLEEVALWCRSLEYVGYFLAYVLLVPRLGYLPSTGLFMLLLTLRLGYRSPRSLIYATAFGFGVAIIFRAFLQVKIPAGSVYEYLPDAIRRIAMIYL